MHLLSHILGYATGLQILEVLPGIIPIVVIGFNKLDSRTNTGTPVILGERSASKDPRAEYALFSIATKQILRLRRATLRMT